VKVTGRIALFAENVYLFYIFKTNPVFTVPFGKQSFFGFTDAISHLP